MVVVALCLGRVQTALGVQEEEVGEQLSSLQVLREEWALLYLARRAVLEVVVEQKYLVEREVLAVVVARQQMAKKAAVLVVEVRRVVFLVPELEREVVTCSGFASTFVVCE